eukprot:XP_024456371.1 uncharacterized protein LOC18098963 isoform X2 [Populus trichocarpa]
MSDGGITVLDGNTLRSLHLSLPEHTLTLTGAQVLDFAESEASQSLLGISLPPHLKSSALRRMNIDGVDDVTSFQLTELSREQASRKLSDYLSAIADELKEFPLLNDILKKHGVEEEGELGQSQFAELLQPIIQELADALAKKHVAVIHKIKIVNGSEIRKVLADEKKLNDAIAKALQGKHKNDQKSTEIIRDFLEKNGEELGLPPSEANEAVILLYDAVFTDIDSGRDASIEEDDFRKLVREILEKFAEQLQANPVYCDLDG